jgi:hypothetical protein
VKEKNQPLDYCFISLALDLWHASLLFAAFSLSRVGFFLGLLGGRPTLHKLSGFSFGIWDQGGARGLCPQATGFFFPFLLS